MNDYLREYDARLRARAREMTDLRTGDEIRAWFAARGTPIGENENPWAHAFGALQGLTIELAREPSNA